MNVLDLFSGIGGFSLGLERAGMRSVAFCEIEPYCRAVLRKHWPDVPCYDDIRTLTADRLTADGIAADVICGGFPCQDISTAGKGAGLAGERSGLWTEYARLIGEIRPRYVIVENVAALLGRGLDRVLGDLAALGFSSVWHCIPASAVGAPHRRDRIWIIARNNDYASCKAINDRSCHIEAALRERQENAPRDSSAPQHNMEAGREGFEGGRREDAQRSRSARTQAVSGLPNVGSPEHWPSVGERGGCASHQSGLEEQRAKEPCRCVEEEAFGFAQTVGSYISDVIYGGIGHVRPDSGLPDDGQAQEDAGLDVGNEGIPAAAVGAPHRRDRVWIIAYPQADAQRPDADCFGSHRAAQHQQRDAEFRDEQVGVAGPLGEALAHPQFRRLESGCEQSSAPEAIQSPKVSSAPGTMAHPIGAGLEGRPILAGYLAGQFAAIERSRQVLADATGGRCGERAAHAGRRGEGTVADQWTGPAGGGWWLVEPAMGQLVNGLSGGLVRFDGRVASGVKDRVPKLKALGNTVVPQIPELIGRAIMQAEGLAP